jgi:hypothetical protein
LFPLLQLPSIFIYAEYGSVKFIKSTLNSYSLHF